MRAVISTCPVGEVGAGWFWDPGLGRPKEPREKGDGLLDALELDWMDAVLGVSGPDRLLQSLIKGPPNGSLELEESGRCVEVVKAGNNCCCCGDDTGFSPEMGGRGCCPTKGGSGFCTWVGRGF